MTNFKTTKRALVSSVLALVMCFSMLLGTTFAWFTDSVTSSGNIIQTGTLEVEMHWADGTKDPASATWTDASEGAIFSNDKWEPGYTDAKHIKVSNAGTLALKYQLSIVPEDTVSELAEVIDVYLYEIADTDANATQITDRTDIDTSMYVGTLADVINNGIVQGNLEAGKSYTTTIVLKMQESAGNDYQGKSIGSFSVQLLATQMTAEEDSFGSDYDSDAWVGGMKAYTASDLRLALDQGGNIVAVGTIDPEETIVASEWGSSPMEFYVDAGKVDTLTGGEYKLNQSAKYGIVVAAVEGQSVTLSDMGITTDSRWSMTLDNYGENIVVENVTINATSGAGIWAYGSDSVTTLNNVTINQAGLSEANASTAWANTAVAVSNGQTLVINGGSYVGQTWAVYGYNSGSNVTINGGTFKAQRVIQLDGVWSGSATSVATINGGNFDGQIYLDWGTNVPELYINGGNFTNFSATVCGEAKLVIKGGTFDADPSAYVAEGYTAIANADGTYTVSMNESSVSTAAELATALKNGGKVTLTADIEASEVMLIGANTVIEGNGYALKTSANRGFRVTTSDVDVVMNGLVITSTAAQEGVSDVRGISIDTNLTNVSLTLNDCKVEFDPYSGDDWAYAVNITGGTTNSITINGGYYEGANVINVWGEGNTVVIDGATLNCTYGDNDSYHGAGVRLNPDCSADITIKNTTVSGDNAVVFCVHGVAEGAYTYTSENVTNNTNNTEEVK